MFCSTCGTEIKPELNYCNRCGARVDKLAASGDNPTALQNLSMAIGFVGLGGLGMTVGLIAILLKNGVKSEVVVMLSLAFLATTFALAFLILRQISQMTKASPPNKENFSEKPQLNSPNTARLEEPRHPVNSVTENTTRTLEKELVK